MVFRYNKRLPKAVRHRLQREGRWGAFKARRREIAKERGYETEAAATREALQEYPPMKVIGVSPKIWAGRPRSSRKADVLWALENSAYEEGSVEPKDAPSAGAWRLMLMLREDSDFYKSVQLKMLDSKMGDIASKVKGSGLSDKDLAERIGEVEKIAASSLQSSAEGNIGESEVSS